MGKLISKPTTFKSVGPWWVPRFIRQKVIDSITDINVNLITEATDIKQRGKKSGELRTCRELAEVEPNHIKAVDDKETE